MSYINSNPLHIKSSDSPIVAGSLYPTLALNAFKKDGSFGLLKATFLLGMDITGVEWVWLHYSALIVQIFTSFNWSILNSAEGAGFALISKIIAECGVYTASWCMFTPSKLAIKSWAAELEETLYQKNQLDGLFLRVSSQNGPSELILEVSILNTPPLAKSVKFYYQNQYSL